MREHQQGFSRAFPPKQRGSEMNGIQSSNKRRKSLTGLFQDPGRDRNDLDFFEVFEDKRLSRGDVFLLQGRLFFQTVDRSEAFELKNLTAHDMADLPQLAQ